MDNIITSKQANKSGHPIFMVFFTFFLIVQYIFFSANSVILWVFWAMLFSFLASIALLSFKEKLSLSKFHFLALLFFITLLFFIVLQLIPLSLLPLWLKNFLTSYNSELILKVPLSMGKLQRGFISINRALTYMVFFKYVGMLAVFIICYLIGQNYKATRRFLNLLLIFASIYHFLIIVDFIIDRGTVFSIPLRHANLRLIGLTQSPNIHVVFSAFIAIVASSFLAYNLDFNKRYFSTIKDKDKYFSGILVAIFSLILSLVSIGLSQSRTSFIIVGAIISFVLLYIFPKNKQNKLPFIIAGCLFLMVSLISIIFISEDNFSRFTMLSVDGLKRLDIYRYYLPFVFPASPLGIGMESFYDFNQLVLMPYNYKLLFALGAMHNFILQLFLEGGYIIVFLTSMLLICLIFPCYKKTYLKDKIRMKYIKMLKLSVAFMLIYFFVHGMLDVVNNTFAANLLFMSLLGITNGFVTKYSQP